MEIYPWFLLLNHIRVQMAVKKKTNYIIQQKNKLSPSKNKPNTCLYDPIHTRTQ